VAGYTFDGGIGWLTAPHGLASAHLHAVDYVDGAGTARSATADADDEVDRAALWAFRGGGDVGIATALEFGLVAVPDLWAGYLLWPGDQLDAVAAAWSAALPDVGPTCPAVCPCCIPRRARPFPTAWQASP